MITNISSPTVERLPLILTGFGCNSVIQHRCFHSGHFGSLSVTKKNAARIIIRRNQKSMVLVKIRLENLLERVVLPPNESFSAGGEH